MSINRVNITGNLTRDPELRQSPGGTSVLRFGVAVNDRRRNQQTGEWEDYPNFVDCVVFANRAESLSRILVKGMKVAVEGKLHYSSWEREGQRRSKLEVYVDDVEFMTARGGGQQGYGQQGYGQQGGGQDQPRFSAPQPAYSAPAPQYQAQPSPSPSPAAVPPSTEVYEDSDIPF